jgi:hypothetical protein
MSVYEFPATSFDVEGSIIGWYDFAGRFVPFQGLEFS